MLALRLEPQLEVCCLVWRLCNIVTAGSIILFPIQNTMAIILLCNGRGRHTANDESVPDWENSTIPSIVRQRLARV